MNAPTARLEALAARGIAVTVSPAGRLRVSPASLLTDDDRTHLREHAGELLASLTRPPDTPPPLTGRESWNQAEVSRLLVEADELPARFGVSGLHPGVRAA